MTRFTKRQYGISLLEILLVLAIIAVSLVMVMRYYKLTDTTNRVNQVFQDIHVVGTASLEWWDDNGHDFTQLSNGLDTLIHQGYLSSSYKKNAFGGSVEITEESADILIIKLTNFPSTVCNNLFNKFNLNVVCPKGEYHPFAICLNGSGEYFDCRAS